MKKVNLTLIKLSFLLVFSFVFTNVSAQSQPETPAELTKSYNVSNVEKVTVFGMSTCLYMLKNLSNDLEFLNKVTNSKNFAKDSLRDFPNFSNELNQIASLETMSSQERSFKIDKTISSIKNKLSASEKWQFEAGRNFGEIVSQLMELEKKGIVYPIKFDEMKLKKHLSEIKALCLNPPSDFPPDVLERLKDLAAESEKNQVVTAENWQVFGGKMGRLMNTISPGSVK